MTAYDDAVLADTPLLYLPLTDTSGTVATALAGANGTYNGAPTLGKAGPHLLTASVGFDDVDDWVSAAAAQGSDYYSMECWANLTLPQGGAIMKWGETPITELGWGIGVGDTNFDTAGSNFIILYEGVRWIPTTVVAATGWHHIVGTVQVTTSDLRLYVDGAQVWSASGGTAMSGPLQNVGVGGYGTRYVAGDIAAPAVYATALTAAQVQAHYDAGVGPAYPDDRSWDTLGWSTAKSPRWY